VRENAYHLVIGLVWLIVTVVAVLVYIADGNVLRRRKKGLQVINVLAMNDTKELLTNMHCGGRVKGAGSPPGAIVSKESLLDKRISFAIALLITFCTGFAADLAWQSSGQILSVPKAAPAPVALSPILKQQLEAMSSGLAAVQQSVDQLSSGLGQMRRNITNLQTTEQALFDKISEPPPRPAAAPPARSTPRPSQAPTPAR
jgi:hypothetical protein